MGGVSTVTLVGISILDVSVPFCSTSLKERTFHTVDFYKDFDGQLTPVGLAFFQSEWDGSVRDVYHSTLGTSDSPAILVFLLFLVLAYYLYVF